MKIEISSEIAAEVAKALNRQADSYANTLAAVFDGETVELERPTYELAWVVDELRRIAEEISPSVKVRKCTICSSALSDAECFEIPEPRMCDECAGHITPELSNEYGE